MGHVTLPKPFALEIWQEVLQKVDPDTTFHDYRTVFEGPRPHAIAARMKEILEEFGIDGQKAVFSVRGDDVTGFWVDPFHNYVATVFSRAKGDEFDDVMVNSIG
jgi:hypothetical protein